ncbi:hypothetical protein FQN55_000606 [Onygenales sp. PD_40]|nr:hypothetical protein FQN55_000606 [Onygenales sp. PD_40]
MSLPSGPQSEAQWEWPDDLKPAEPTAPTEPTGSSPQQPSEAHNAQHGQEEPAASSAQSSRHYPSRTCRICLEVVPPTLEPVSEHLPGFLQSPPRVTYKSSDPESGRLIRPCKCKGTTRYVHEGCLNQWRHTDPSYGSRNFWQCPTCGFQYRLERMRWGRWISSTTTQLILTVLILLLTMFVLGFVADPIINLYVDPYDTVLSSGLWDTDEDEMAWPVEELGPISWTEHFIKGLASLGVLGFVKVLFALSPWQWWNLRNSGLFGGSRRPAATGRDRVTSVSWIVLVIGIMTFLYSVYRGVRAWSYKVLQKAGDRVLDVPLPDDDDEFEDTIPVPADHQSSTKEE